MNNDEFMIKIRINNGITLNIYNDYEHDMVTFTIYNDY